MLWLLEGGCYLQVLDASLLAGVLGCDVERCETYPRRYYLALNTLHTGRAVGWQNAKCKFQAPPITNSTQELMSLGTHLVDASVIFLCQCQQLNLA